ncbi:NADP(H)-dependent aldo-keto reductase [Kordiimonas aestuarii]|uniref:NADP(H)-dependent aldo-keto reductase n=1 Tax=Kordiimonas aestuarii TaxID=1005925 RepID=UPI0021CFFCAF|nr:NADP(H)-dependent aldo-keto reductase [Kordiimonas aestuarii]
MRYRELGTTGIRVSEICLGSMTWGEQNTEAEGHAQIDRALAAGVNFIDTAEMYAVPARAETYGRTEEIIGSWIEASGKRDDIVLATKVASAGRNFSYMRPDIHDGVTKLDRVSVHAACDASLKRLRTDYIDLYQLHWPERPTNCFGHLRYRHLDDGTSTSLEETLSALKELVDAGKVRAVGVSNETAWGVTHCLSLADKLGLPRIASTQNPYSLLNRTYEVALAEIGIREQVGLLAHSPLAFGVLTGKYMGGKRPPGARMTLWNDKFPRYWTEKTVEATERYVEVAREYGLSGAQMAIAFVLSQPFVTSAVIGATTVKQLDELLAATEITLDKDLLKALDHIDNDLTFPCP